MRRFARRLFTLAAALSLLLLVAICLLWVRSYWYEEAVAWTAEGDDGTTGAGFEIFQSKGVGGASYFDDTWELIDPDAGPGLFWYIKPQQAGERGFHTVKLKLGFGYAAPPDFGLAVVAFPHWFAAVACAGLPAAWMVGRVRRRRDRARDRCLSCGYDLRASPDRCPECGTAVPNSAPSGVG